MNFDLDTDQRDIASGAKDWFSSVAKPADARAALDGADIKPGRAGLAEIGFLGITVPEEQGGAGQSVLDLAVVAEQAGRVLAGPSITGAGRAATLLRGTGTTSLLEGLADGSRGIAVLDGDPFSVSAGTASGRSAASLDVLGADTYLALGDLDGAPAVVSMRADASGVSTASGTPLDPTRGLACVLADGADIEVLARGEDARAAWEHATLVAQVLIAAETLGSAAACLERGVEYGNLREAFGRKIGSYQAVKHQLVDSFVQVEQLRSLVWYGAWAADHGTDELMLAASAAKALAADAGEHAAETMIQVHGGIGFTWEHDAHLYWRRAKVDRLLLGDADHHRDTVARLTLAAAAADPLPPAKEAAEVAEGPQELSLSSPAVSQLAASSS